MSKFYFNSVLGNNFDGYHLNYDGKEFIVNPGISSNREDCFNIHSDELSNGYPYNPMINSVFTPSGYFNYATDMNFFDPMSVFYLARSKYSENGTSMTAKAEAFPMTLSGFVACNHLIQRNYTEYFISNIHPEINGVFKFSDSSKCVKNTVVEEQYKKDVFSFAKSFNIKEAEDQLNTDWNSLIETNTDITSMLYSITSNDNFNGRVSLAVSGNNTLEHVIPSGVENDISKAKYIWKYKTDAYLLTTTNGVYKNENNETIYLQDDTYILCKKNASYQNALMVPVYNENDESDYQFILFSADASSKLANGLSLYPFNAVKLTQNKERGKWELKFSNSSLFYEGDLNTNFYSRNGLPLSLNNGGNVESSPSMKLYPYVFYNSKYRGNPAPFMLSDERWGKGVFEKTCGEYIYPKSELYPERYKKNNTYICADMATYSILI